MISETWNLVYIRIGWARGGRRRTRPGSLNVKLPHLDDQYLSAEVLSSRCCWQPGASQGTDQVVTGSAGK